MQCREKNLLLRTYEHKVKRYAEVVLQLRDKVHDIPQGELELLWEAAEIPTYAREILASKGSCSYALVRLTKEAIERAVAPPSENDCRRPIERFALSAHVDTGAQSPHRFCSSNILSSVLVSILEAPPGICTMAR
jgi:hypothetical protein